MTPSEYTAIQVTVFVRTPQGGGPRVQEFFDSVPFQYQLQDTVATQLKAQLAGAEIDFEEVIVSIDNPAERAKKVRTKSSLMERLLGRDKG